MIIPEQAVEAAADAIKARFAQSFPDLVSMLNPRLHIDLAEAALTGAGSLASVRQARPQDDAKDKVRGR